VRERWPTMNLTPGKLRVPHTGIADAACLAEYGMLRGKP
jgi:crossover junction endodeoxyribonuclease RuvC